MAIAAAGCSATGAGTQTAQTDGTTQTNGTVQTNGSGQTSSAAAIPAHDGPGVTSTTITASWFLWLDIGEGESTQMVDQDSAAGQAIVATFNAEGGVDGRRIRLLPADQDPGKALVKQRQQAAARNNGLPLPDPTNGKAVCDAYADTPVFAFFGSDLVSPPYGTPAAGACLNAAGHPIIGVGDWSQADYQAAPATAGLDLAADHDVDALIAAGKNAGVIGPPGKIDILTDATQPAASFTADIAALAKAGVTDTQVIAVNPTLSQADALNLVVKLKASGATRVISLLSDEVSGRFFMAMAPVLKQQQFYPKTLVLSDWLFQALAYEAHGLPTALANSIDLYTYERPETEMTEPAQIAQTNATPAGKLCAAAAKTDPTLAQKIAGETDLCDTLELFKAALSASGSSYVNAQAFTAGLDKLRSYSSPSLFRTDFDATHHDGAAGIVREPYSPTCQCSVYSSTVIPF